MSIIKSSGLKQFTKATERGWETAEGKLIVASRNLLTNRVMKNYATPEEVLRWSEIQLIEIESSVNKHMDTFDTNKNRLEKITEAFNFNNKTLFESKSTSDQIEYHKRKIEYLKLVLEYEKSFASIQNEIDRLNNIKSKIQIKKNHALQSISSEDISENVSFSPETSKEEEQKDQTDKSLQSEKVEVQTKKRQRKKRTRRSPGRRRNRVEEKSEHIELTTNPVFDVIAANNNIPNELTPATELSSPENQE